MSDYESLRWEQEGHVVTITLLLGGRPERSRQPRLTKDLAQRAAALPPRTASMIKENLNRAGERSIEENLEAESITQALCFASDDTREAVTAWLEKREPRFTGR